MSPSAGEKVRAGDTVELVDFGDAAIDLGGRERFDRMTKFALERNMLERTGEGVFIVEPEIALLAKADLVAHALVVLDRRAA